MDTAWMPIMGPIKTCLPLGVLFLLIQGISEIFKSWDRFIFARMFGRGSFLWGDPIWVPKDSNDAEMERLLQVLEDSLNDLTHQADIYCGHQRMDPAPNDNEPVIPAANLRGSGK